MKLPLSATAAWIDALQQLLDQGNRVKPRGLLTLELPSYQLVVCANQPVVGVASRAMNYSFMAAEALWILSGDNTVAGIAPWNKHIANYSDDGVTFFGAYGPPIASQLDYVVNKLVDDQDTRQAVLTIWRQNPTATKDYPCTVAMSFQVRNGQLHNHVFMRSNDAWLGTVYDIFNFSMITAKVACLVNKALRARDSAREALDLGNIYLTAASFHIYAEHCDPAHKLLAERQLKCLTAPKVPQRLIINGDWPAIEHGLLACRDKTNTPVAWNPRPL